MNKCVSEPIVICVQNNKDVPIENVTIFDAANSVGTIGEADGTEFIAQTIAIVQILAGTDGKTAHNLGQIPVRVTAASSAHLSTPSPIPESDIFYDDKYIWFKPEPFLRKIVQAELYLNEDTIISHVIGISYKEILQSLIYEPMSTAKIHISSQNALNLNNQYVIEQSNVKGISNDKIIATRIDPNQSSDVSYFGEFDFNIDAYTKLTIGRIEANSTIEYAFYPDKVTSSDSKLSDNKSIDYSPKEMYGKKIEHIKINDLIKSAEQKIYKPIVKAKSKESEKTLILEKKKSLLKPAILIFIAGAILYNYKN